MRGLEQLSDVYAKSIGQRLHRVQGWIRASALDAAHVATGKSALVGKCLLR